MRRSWLLAGVILAAGCGAGIQEEPAAAEAGLRVAVSIAPQRFVVQRIAGEDLRVQVQVLVPPGQSPATFDPPPRQMAGLAGSRMLIRFGVPFERRLLERIEQTFPDLVIVDGLAGITLSTIDGRELLGARADHDEGAHEETAGHVHSAEMPDPHVWLDPQRMKIHAQVVCAALCEVLPQRCGELEVNLGRLEADLDAVDERIAHRLAPLAGRRVFVFHPAYGYFTRRYGLHQVAVEEDGHEPTANRLAELVEAARSEGVRTIFVQPQFSGRSARAVAGAVGGRVVELDPLSEQYLENLEQMAERIAAALQEGP